MLGLRGRLEVDLEVRSKKKPYPIPNPTRECGVKQGNSEAHEAAPELEGSWEEEGCVCVHGAAGMGGVASRT